MSSAAILLRAALRVNVLGNNFIYATSVIYDTAELKIWVIQTGPGFKVSSEILEN